MEVWIADNEWTKKRAVFDSQDSMMHWLSTQAEGGEYQMSGPWKVHSDLAGDGHPHDRIRWLEGALDKARVCSAMRP